MHSLPKCIKTGKKRPKFFSKYKGALYSLPLFKLLFLHIFVYSQFCLLENSSFHVLGQTKSPLPVNANAIGRINSPIPVTSCIKSVSSYTSILQSTKKDIFLSFFDIFFSFFFCKFFSELFAVSLVKSRRPWGEVGECPPSEYDSGP